MKKTTKLLIGLAISFLIFGIIEGTNHKLDLSLVHGAIIAILLFIWCGAHATENNIENSSVYKLFVVLLPPIGLPVYFYRFFGFKNGSLKVLLAIGLGILMLLAYGLPYELLSNKNV